MASSSRSVLDIISQKLCVEKRITDKAEELNELLEAKAGAGSLAALRLTGSCRLVACVDLAARSLGCTVSQADVVRVSSMNKKSYNEAVKVIANILGLEERVTLRELAIQFGCTGVVTLATEILQRYISDQCSDVDYHTPLFLCAALVAGTRKQKVKIDMVKLREHSGVKKSALEKLITIMEKYVHKAPDSRKRSPSKNRDGLLEAIDLQDKEHNLKKSRLDESTPCKNGTVSKKDYEEWKRRILAQAQLS
ncbi:origin recognition complex subunit 6-like isoform X1 [Physella acuta]|uniref:origin recognition complex subunit 6-like isoform X1 n=1 Tax=Physella acuta TaxID=109671 RepID=UPI0027DE93A2|nr:origin recognition complex subunit 6-like isoform X1 [Physella acuta]